MGIIKRQGEKSTPDFTEDDYISAIETAMNRSFYYRDKEIEISRISQTDENELGYDGILSTIVPFYIQFKRSYFYSPQFKGALLTGRKSVCLPTNRGFYALELLKKNGRYDQHNTMYLLSQKAKASYVAPLFYKSKDLARLKSYGNRLVPSYFDDISIYDFTNSSQYQYSNIRFFKDSITITPHNSINDQEPSHHYSYCKGLKIGFHSEPINLENSESENLLNFINEIVIAEKREDTEIQVSKIFDSIPDFFNLERASKDIEIIIQNSINRISSNDRKGNSDLILGELTTTDKLLILEDILYEYFGIRQLIRFERK
jgi:hypothetical protein